MEELHLETIQPTAELTQEAAQPSKLQRLLQASQRFFAEYAERVHYPQ